MLEKVETQGKAVNAKRFFGKAVNAKRFFAPGRSRPGS